MPLSLNKNNKEINIYIDTYYKIDQITYKDIKQRAKIENKREEKTNLVTLSLWTWRT